MPVPYEFILIKGEPKALQIDSIRRENGVYAVQYASSPREYHYKQSDVVWLRTYLWYDPLLHKVWVNGQVQHNVSNIMSFEQSEGIKHWRITYANGSMQDYLHGTVRISETCLAHKAAQNVWYYLKDVAHTNELGRNARSEGLLYAAYGEVDFIDPSWAVAPYIASNRYKLKHYKLPDLIFPFGCNASQMKAVKAAFTNQISVVQGPPGTGKTQTILNIIANILLQNKTVIVVSNNNSAVGNVLEKLRKYELDYVAAYLGNRENKAAFYMQQQVLPEYISHCNTDSEHIKAERSRVNEVCGQLSHAFRYQEQLAAARQEYSELQVEWKHFVQDNHIDASRYVLNRKVSSAKIMNLWLYSQSCVQGESVSAHGWIACIITRIRQHKIRSTCRRLLGAHAACLQNNMPVITDIQAYYYVARMRELQQKIESASLQLENMDLKRMTDNMTAGSMEVLKTYLGKKYARMSRIQYNASSIKNSQEAFLQQYPVVLSTTFSARVCVPNVVYDYLIMDEASQEAIVTGAIALTCAKNAVIVGDVNQLPPVITEADRQKLTAIFQSFHVPAGYDCSRNKNSFLQSVCTVLPQVEITLLREHYRCHPKIINFCNQKFYGGKLLIMTENHDDDHVMTAIKTVPGQHARGHYNQREIDVVKQEVLPLLAQNEDVGIITPYNDQVQEFNRQLPGLETATVHKYQGREKNSIIMSVVDDHITEFSNDPNLLNVAISRAKKHFYIVLSGNTQPARNHISDLVDYIEYNNCTVTHSKVSSVFDYLYKQYTRQRMEYLKNAKRIAEYDSENLTYALINNIIDENPDFGYLGVYCHIPLRNIIKDTSLMSEEEVRYVSQNGTHVDFLIVNHVTKKPVLVVETDGYAYHKTGTKQSERDIKKNHILEIYEIPLLRLSTIGSGEKEKIITCLNDILNEPLG